MSVLFNHACRYEFFDRNPIYLVRQSAKRRRPPTVLVPGEIRALLDNLGIRERTLVLLAVSTGLRQSELFGLKWGDIDFAQRNMSVTRSIVYGEVGPCKTESSQKPVPIQEQVNRELDEELGEYLEMADDEKMKQGMSRQDALRAVRLEGGSLDGTKEIVRSGGWESVVDALWRDLLFAARMLRKSPGFTLVAMLTLAIAPHSRSTIAPRFRFQWFYGRHRIWSSATMTTKVILTSF